MNTPNGWTRSALRFFWTSAALSACVAACIRPFPDTTRDGSVPVDATVADRSAPVDGSSDGMSRASDADAADAHDADATLTEAAEAGTPDSGGACVISGQARSSGTANPDNQCQSCQPSLSPSEWTNVTDGTSCGTSGICHSGACASGCEIGGAFFMTTAVNPNDPCQICQPAQSTSTFNALADGTGCGNVQVCANGQCGTQCEVGGSIYPSGAANATNACLSCQPALSTTAWTNLANGTSCASAEVCNAGACSSGCVISGTYYASGAVNTTACQSCQPAVSTSAWTNLAAGASCGSGEVCNAGSCASGCTIATTFYPAGTVNTSGCESCQPTVSTTAWTNLANGTSCASAEVCNAGACSSGCVISGTYYASGAVNTTACQSCQPAVSTSAWTNLANGASCGSGEVCNTGACASGCVVGGAFFASGSSISANPCETCQPSASTSALSPLSDGTACGNGQVCAKGQCGTQCDIGGTVVASGAVNPANSCQSCQPATSTSEYTNLPQSTACAGGDVCNTTGGCVSGCGIGGTYYAPGQLNPNNACQSCQPGKSSTVFSSVAAGTSCAGGEACNVTASAATCSPGCGVGGVFYAPGSLNPSNSCQSCQNTTSTIAFQDLSPGAACAPGEACNITAAVAACASGCGIGGAFYLPGAANPTNACQTCQPNTSTTSFSNAPLGTTCGTGGEVCVTGTCTPGCVVGGTFFGPNTSGTNVCQTCQASSTSTFTNLANGTACGTNSTCETTGAVATCTCGAGFTQCGGACANLLSDPGNCGACGHSCLGAGCGGNGSVTAPGYCQPVTLAQNQAGVEVVMADSNNFYWANFNNGLVIEQPLNGGAPVTLSATTTNTNYITLDSTYVYFTGTGGVYKVPIVNPQGSTPVVTPIVTGVSGNALILNNGTLYWTAGSLIQSISASVTKAQAASASTLATNQSNSAYVVTDSTNLYWTNAVTDGGVMGMALGGTTPFPIAINQSEPIGMAVDSNYVYWSDNMANTIMAASKAPLGQQATPPTVIASNQNQPSVGMAVDSSGLYWGTTSGGTAANGTIVKLSLPAIPSSTPVTLVSGQLSPVWIFLTPQYIYWANYSATVGQVMRVAK